MHLQSHINKLLLLWKLYRDYIDLKKMEEAINMQSNGKEQ